MPITQSFPLSGTVRNLRQSATLLINERSKELIAEGKTVYRLGFGQSPFPVPPIVVSALRANAEEKDYLPVRGLPALREAVAEHGQREHGLKCTAENVLIGPGSKELIFNTQLALDADLLLPSPSWVSYEPQANLVKKRCTWLPTDEPDGWRLMPETLENECRTDPGRPRLLILNYPNNPTGHNYSSTHLAAIAETARANNVIVLADEIYGLASHGSRHVSIANFYPEGTIVSSGLSKWAGAGGWRLGTCVFPPELRWLSDALAGIASETFSAVSAPIQHAAVTAFSNHPEITAYKKNMLRVLQGAGGFVCQKLRSLNLSMPSPEGGFYLFPNFENHRSRLSARGIRSSAGLCAALLDEVGVALLPGEAFGRPAKELTARLSYVDFDGKKALEAAAEISDEKLDEGFVKKHCPQIPLAMKAIEMFLNKG